MKNFLLAFLVLIVLLPSLLPLVPVDIWWVRWCEFPRPQILGLSVAAAAVVLLFAGNRTWLLLGAAALVVAAAWQAWCIWPFTAVGAVETKLATPGRHPTLRVLAANVLQENRQVQPLLDMVRRVKPDIVVLTETDDWWAKAVSELEADFEHKIAQPQSNHYGMIVFSRLPVTNHQVQYLVEEEIPSIHFTVRLNDGTEVFLIALHPSPPRPKFSGSQRDAELVLAGREVKERRMPAIVAGDLNDVGWSDTTRLFQRVSGMLDPRRGRGLYATFPAQVPLGRWPLDHLFHTEEFRLENMQVMPPIGSDHLPLLVELSYEPNGAAAQPAPREVPGDDQREAETLEEAREDKEERRQEQ